MKKGLAFGLGAAAGAAAVGVAVSRARRAARVGRLREATTAHGKQIVILGAGFGGINTAHHLLRQLPPESGWTVMLIDRQNYSLFTPLLYQAATGLVEPANILFPVRTLSHAPNFKFRESTLQDVDFDSRRVLLDDGEVTFDHLVIALGSVTNFFGKEADLREALQLKSIADSILIRNRIIDAFERADISTDEEERRRCLTFLVVGGGATGVELAGAIRGLVCTVLLRHYPGIRRDEIRIVICEALGEILPGISRGLAAFALRRLRGLGIEVRLETPVERVDAGGAILKGGESVPSRTVVWAAGVRPSPLVDRMNVPKAKNGRILVDRFLEVEGHPGVYALGDITASLDPKTGKPLPPSAAVAVQEAPALADILVARIEGRPARPFEYHPRGELISLGRHQAVAEVAGVRLTGVPAWILWRAFYLSQLMGFKNRLSVALDWTFAYLYQRDIVQIEYPGFDTELPSLREGAAAEKRPRGESKRAREKVASGPL
jgi:NADH dehydrogenase